MKELFDSLPPILWRKDPRFREITGISPVTMRKLDSQGLGPIEIVRSGSNVGYPKDALIKWLKKNLKVEKRG